MSSIKHAAPAIPTRWNISGPEVIPNGRRVKRYLPNGVMNVVKSEDSGASGICQNPEAASYYVSSRRNVFFAQLLLNTLAMY